MTLDCENCSRKRVVQRLAFFGITILAIGEVSLRNARSDDGNEFFERQVRPLLVAKCFECHGDEEQEGGLRLTSQAHVLKGGMSGAAVGEGKGGGTIYG